MQYDVYCHHIHYKRISPSHHRHQRLFLKNKLTKASYATEKIT